MGVKGKNLKKGVHENYKKCYLLTTNLEPSPDI